jgi:glucarate dehydratase
VKITRARVTPIAFKDPPLLNAAGIHEPYALRSILEVESESGHVGLGESGDALRRCSAPRRPSSAGTRTTRMACARSSRGRVGMAPAVAAPSSPRLVAGAAAAAYSAFESPC